MGITMKKNIKINLTILSVFSLVLSLVTFSGRVGAQTCPALPTDKGLSTNSNINITSSGTYYVWLRVMVPDTSNNSVYVQMNNSLCNINFGDSASIPANTWTWINYKDGNTGSRVSTSLTSGTANTLYIAGKENGVKVDKALLLSDANCTPQAMGDNCTETSAPTTPTGLVASGITQTSMVLNWNASTDNVGVTGYEVYRNGTRITTTTSRTYTNTGLTAGTTYSYYVIAYDAAGNKSPQSATIQATTTGGTTGKTGDFNKDGYVDGIDLSKLLTDWDPTGIKPASICNIAGNDNLVNGLDLSAVLSSWSPKP